MTDIALHSSNHSHIAKMSMRYGELSIAFERALASHQRHADRWGYPFYVSRKDVGCGFWNKPTFILSILNPNIPGEVFLPPAGSEFDHIHIIASQDQNGFNAGVFYLRVSEWSVSMLVEAISYPLCNSEEDLGRNMDQEAMLRTFNTTEGGPEGEGYKEGVAYLPRTWFVAYEYGPGSWNDTHIVTLNEFAGSKMRHLYEGQVGDFLVHFPGIDPVRQDLVNDWADLIEGEYADTWAIPLNETGYPGLSRDFWTQYGEAVGLLDRAAGKGHDNPLLMDAAQRLRDSLAVHADNSTMLSSLMSDVSLRLHRTERLRF